MKLVASDLDGTLVGRDLQMSDRTVAVLNALPVPLVIVTGRPIRWLGYVYDQLSTVPLAVVANGAAVYDPHSDHLLYSASLTADELAHACATLRAAIPDAVFAVERDGGRRLLSEPAHPVSPWEQNFRSWRTAELAELVAEPAAKLLVCANDRDADEFTALVSATLLGAYETTQSSPSGLVEISGAGVTKASGLAWVAARLGVYADDVVAFGDMPNDIPMLIWAATGVAMANAHPAVLAAADEITLSNEEDGVASWLERNLPLT
jgi:Cof subfamily protein (haloacid dehalogenase superfamily)